MSKALENLLAAQKFAMSIRPKVGGFPYLAEALNRAGVTKNLWSLPSCQSIYVTKYGSVVHQGEPITNGFTEIPRFDREALIRALRTDQAGQSTLSEFLKSSWEAGVVSYDVDFVNRRVTYFGATGETYVEDYPAVNLETLDKK